VNVTNGRVLQPNASLSSDIVADADELELQPVLVAGSHGRG